MAQKGNKSLCSTVIPSIETMHKSEADDNEDITLKEQVEGAKRNMYFLQTEHAKILQGLYEEIEKLHDYVKDLHFQWHVLEVLVPDHDFFRCDSATLAQKVEDLLAENSDLRRRLQETNKGLELLDQKQKLEKWQHHQELVEKDKTILCLQKELETKCNMIAELTSRSPSKKRSNFLSLFSFNSEASPSFVNRQTLASLKCQNIEVDDSHTTSSKARSLPPSDSPSHSLNYDYSSYSSLSDKSNSDDEVFRVPLLRKQYTFPSPKYGYRRRWYQPSHGSLRLPPLPNREFVRHQIRVDKTPAKTLDSLAIDRISFPQIVD